MKVVVIGAGHAGVAFVDAMRRNGFAGELTMIDRLAGLPLERPPLSKAFLLAEDGDEDGFALRAPGWFADSRITLLTGRDIAGLDVDANRMTLDDGSVLPYDRLVLATGATPHLLPGTAGLAGVFVLRDPDDARHLRAVRSVLIIGGGYRSGGCRKPDKGWQGGDRDRGRAAPSFPCRQPACLGVLRGPPRR